jgi:hypothetical protein
MRTTNWPSTLVKIIEIKRRLHNVCAGYMLYRALVFILFWVGTEGEQRELVLFAFGLIIPLKIDFSHL